MFGLNLVLEQCVLLCRVPLGIHHLLDSKSLDSPLGQVDISKVSGAQKLQDLVVVVRSHPSQTNQDTF